MVISHYKEVIQLGETISIGDSLIITIFCMIIVFLTLLIISYLIGILRVVSSKDNDIKQETKIEKESLNINKSMDDEELVAVIAAAIACSLGVDVPKVKIKSIRRVSQDSPIWAKVGREEQILNRL